MKVLLVSQYYAPEVGATQNRMMEFTQAFVRAGHEIDVLTEVPNHPSGVIRDEFRGAWWRVDASDGARVARVWVATSPRKNFRTRLAFYFSFMTLSVLGSLRLRRRYDVVVATSPPLPAALAGLAISRLKRAKFVLDVRDLWPRAAVALGELSPGRIYRAAEHVESLLYRSSTLITATTGEFCTYIEERGIPAARIAHVPNGTRPDVFRPEHPGAAAFRSAHELDSTLLVMYAGLHGIAQGLDTILDAAALLRERKDVAFVLMGEGPMKAALVAGARARQLDNVRFLPEAPLDACAAALAAADVCLVPLAANQVFEMFVPSKLFDAMAAGRPVVLSVDGEARAILESCDGGVFVPPGDAQGIADAITRLGANPGERRDMGARGRQFVLDRYDRRREADRFVAATAAAVAGGGR